MKDVTEELMPDEEELRRQLIEWTDGKIDHTIDEFIKYRQNVRIFESDLFKDLIIDYDKYSAPTDVHKKYNLIKGRLFISQYTRLQQYGDDAFNQYADNFCEGLTKHSDHKNLNELLFENISISNIDITNGTHFDFATMDLTDSNGFKIKSSYLINDVFLGEKGSMVGENGFNTLIASQPTDKFSVRCRALPKEYILQNNEKRGYHIDTIEVIKDKKDDRDDNKTPDNNIYVPIDDLVTA